MLSNVSEFEVLLARYDDDPAICSKILRTYSLTHPKAFLGYARTVLREQPVSRGLKFITGLAISAGFIPHLLELCSQSREQALAVAEKALACEPRLDIQILEFLQRPRPAQPGDENEFHVGLNLLNAISPGDRLVPGVLKLLKHANPKVRSKAALFIGGRTQNLAWAASRTGEDDSRVRANIIESLYGLNSDFVHQTFRQNVADENNRVAGNAVLGLYLLGDTAAIALIQGMARHPDARFRNTCAWVMGRTGDPRFAQLFSELMNDPNELVRAQAFKGLGEVRKALRASATRPQLRAAITKVEFEQESSLVITVHNSSNQPVQSLPATSFILKTGTPSKPVHTYTVTEYDGRSSLNVAFVLCLPAEDQAAVEARFVQAVQSCSSLRRSKDKWSIVKIAAKTHGDRAGGTSPDGGNVYRQRFSILNVDFEPSTASVPQEHHWFEYSVNQFRIDAMLREPAITLGGTPGDQLTKTVLDSLLRVDIASSNPHLIFFGAGPKHHLVQELTAKGPELPATVHVLAESSSWAEPTVQSLANATGGMYRALSEPAALLPGCFEMYSSLLHHYRLAWQGNTSNIELEIYSEAGRGSATYETASEQLVATELSA